MAVKTTRSSVIWTPQRRRRTALFAVTAVAVVMSLLPNVSDAVDGDGDLQFFCDEAVRHKYCGGDGTEDREWVHSYHVSVTGVAFLCLHKHSKSTVAVGDHPEMTFAKVRVI